MGLLPIALLCGCTKIFDWLTTLSSLKCAECDKGNIKMTYTEKLYEADFYTWTIQTAQLLKERRFDELDLENLIEEYRRFGPL
jgi:Domain of unknown function DUF29